MHKVHFDVDFLITQLGDFAAARRLKKVKEMFWECHNHKHQEEEETHKTRQAQIGQNSVRMKAQVLYNDLCYIYTNMITEYAERTNVANLCSTNPYVFVCSFVSERKLKT